MPFLKTTLVVACATLAASALFADGKDSPPLVKLGERLSFETRFTHFYALRARDDINKPLEEGDPSLDYSDTATGPVNGAFAGLATNCRACHPATEYKELRGNRAYADFARRSPIEYREDGRRRTVRNSPAFVDIAAEPEGRTFFHYDGEFSSLRELVVETMAGRNYGWLPQEREAALKNIVRVIREDDGTMRFPPVNGGSYAEVFRGGEDIGPAYRIPEENRFDVSKATDAEILDHVGACVEAYMLSLRYSRDDSGLHDGSPYDAFLAANDLPRARAEKESGRAYARRLLKRVEALKSPKFVDDPDREMTTFARPMAFKFGAKELEGLKIFLREPDPERPAAKGVGNCAACHTPPAFTDFRFHNTGVTQAAYEAEHGRGAFNRLDIPDLAKRNASPEQYLPASAALPAGESPFMDTTDRRRPGRTDLGLWNVFAHPGLPKSQPALRAVLARGRSGLSDDRLLAESVALFKTPSLRLLGQSDPYMHDGSRPTLGSVVSFYGEFFGKVARGEVRNAAPEMSGPALDRGDELALEAFLESLNEDYE